MRGVPVIVGPRRVHHATHIAFVEQAAAHHAVRVVAIRTLHMPVIRIALAQHCLGLDKILATLVRLLQIAADGADIVHFITRQLLGIAYRHMEGQLEVGLDIRHLRVHTLRGQRAAITGMTGEAGFFDGRRTADLGATGPGGPIRALAQQAA